MKIGNVNSVAPSEVAQRPKPVEVKTQTISKDAGISKEQISSEKAQKSDGSVDKELLEKSVDQANKTLTQHNRYIERKVHDVTKAIMYTLKDSETEEVIAEFPPEKLQDMIAKMWELAGLVIDERG